MLLKLSCLGIDYGIIGLKFQNQFRFFKYIGSEIGIFCKTISVISPQKKRNAPNLRHSLPFHIYRSGNYFSAMKAS